MGFIRHIFFFILQFFVVSAAVTGICAESASWVMGLLR